MDPQLEKVLKNTISVEKVLTQTSRGGLTYDDPIAIPCYIAGEVKMVRNREGQEVVSTLSVYISGTKSAPLALTHNDRITLPDSRQPPIIAITPYTDEKGSLYATEVNL